MSGEERNHHKDGCCKKRRAAENPSPFDYAIKETITLIPKSIRERKSELHRPCWT